MYWGSVLIVRRLIFLRMEIFEVIGYRYKFGNYSQNILRRNIDYIYDVDKVYINMRRINRCYRYHQSTIIKARN